MAYLIGKWVLMRHFFPDVSDPKKRLTFEQAYENDMRFILATGKVLKATQLLSNKAIVADLCKFAVQDQASFFLN